MREMRTERSPADKRAPTKSGRSSTVIQLLPYVCALLLFGSARSQGVLTESAATSAPTSPNTDQSPHKIRVAADLVQIPVTVCDQQGVFVAGLRREHFKLYDDNIEQVITHFAIDDAPVSIGFVVDASSSMSDKWKRMRQAVAAILRTANAEDEFFLVQFNYQVDLVMGMTSATKELANHVLSKRPEGTTSLWDAIYFSIGEMKNARNTRKALVVVSDGGDNTSRHKLREVKDALHQADLAVYAVGIFEPNASRFSSIEELAGPELLRQITEDTGGRLFEVHRDNEIAEAASKIGAGLRNRYVLGYMPSKRDGNFHQVDLIVVEPQLFPTFHAYWRRRYYAPPD
jgi:Ca-activated chloride channel family protein